MRRPLAIGVASFFAAGVLSCVNLADPVVGFHLIPRPLVPATGLAVGLASGLSSVACFRGRSLACVCDVLPRALLVGRLQAPDGALPIVLTIEGKEPVRGAREAQETGSRKQGAGEGRRRGAARHSLLAF